MTERLTGGLSRTIMVSFVLLIALYGFFFLRFDTILDDSIFPGAVYRPLRIDTESDAL
ncbi:MAG TPA: hypothetical protein PK765_05425 [bacterium]|nr:hypothetical protein [bacterium]